MLFYYKVSCCRNYRNLEMPSVADAAVCHPDSPSPTWQDWSLPAQLLQVLVANSSQPSAALDLSLTEESRLFRSQMPLLGEVHIPPGHRTRSLPSIQNTSEGYPSPPRRQEISWGLCVTCDWNAFQLLPQPFIPHAGVGPTGLPANSLLVNPTWDPQKSTRLRIWYYVDSLWNLK